MRDFGLDWLGQLELVILIEEVSGVELPDDGYRSDPIGRRVGAVNEECGGEQVSRDTGYNSRRSAHPWIASARIEQSQINGGSLLAKPRAR